MLVGFIQVRPPLYGQAGDVSSASYTYDANGQITTITEQVSGSTRVTTLTYDTAGRVQTSVSVLLGRQRTESYTYDPEGNVATMTATEITL